MSRHLKSLLSLVLVLISSHVLANPWPQFEEAVRNGPSVLEMDRIEEDLRTSQCSAATLYTLLPPGNRPAYQSFVRLLVDKGYLSKKGTNVPSMVYFLGQLGHPSHFLPKSPGLPRIIADAVDAGHVVLLRIDALQAFNAQLNREPSPVERLKFALGADHVVRVTKSRRDASGAPVMFGLYDSNVPKGGFITVADLESMLRTFKPRMLLHGGTGAIITDEPWQ